MYRGEHCESGPRALICLQKPGVFIRLAECLLITFYFFRVIQEAAFSANSIIFCGDQQVDMRDFATAVDVVRKRLNSISSPPEESKAIQRTREILPNFNDSPATRLLDIIKRVFEWSDNGIIIKRMLSLD